MVSLLIVIDLMLVWRIFSFQGGNFLQDSNGVYDSSNEVVPHLATIYLAMIFSTLFVQSNFFLRL